MALFAKIKTWIAGEKLTATDLNAEFTNVEELLDGTSTDAAVKVTYNAADLPAIEAASSTPAAHAFEASVTGAGASGLVVHDGSSEVIDLKRDGTVSGKTLASTVSTGTAPLTVASSTLVSNLNADLLDGVEGSGYLSASGDQTITDAVDDLTWTFQGATGVNLVWDDTGADAQYKFRNDGSHLLIQHQEASGGYTSMLRLDGPNTNIEALYDLQVNTNIDVKGNNKATIQNLSDAATIAWDADSGSCATVTITANRTLGNISNAQAGATYTLIVKQDAGGGNTLSWGSYYKFAGGTAPTLTSTGSATDIFTIFAENASTLHVVAVQDMS